MKRSIKPATYMLGDLISVFFSCLSKHVGFVYQCVILVKVANSECDLFQDNASFGPG